MSNSYHDGFEVQEVGGVTVVGFKNRRLLDETIIHLVEEEFCSQVDNLRYKKILLNLKNVDYLSSAALRVLITLHKKIEIAGGELSLCNVTPGIHEVFVITRLDKVFRIETSSPDRESPDGNAGGVGAETKPRKPSPGGAVGLNPPAPAPDQ